MNVQGTIVRLGYAVDVARTEPSREAPEVPLSADARDDAGLLGCVALGGDAARDALEQLFLRHSGPLLRFMRRVTRNDTDAEDIVHDCFVRVAEAARSYRAEGQFRTWLFSMALNLVRTQQRRLAVREKSDPVVVAQQSARWRERAENDPALSAQKRELLQRVDAAIATLNDAERDIFLLYWFGQLTYPEISQVSGVSVSAAKVRVHRALARLGKILKGLN
jgi:RNA polymerase sigma-70 factor (ECF subfamily)